MIAGTDIHTYSMRMYPCVNLTRLVNVSVC